jgi:siroheme synthase (precorrin-2 oxidase/ferrochelatase)
MKTKANNELFPVFLKLNDLNVLIIGGGKIGLEKLSSVLLNSPLSRVKVVAISFIDELKQFVESYPLVELIESEFKVEHLEGMQIVISGFADR